MPKDPNPPLSGPSKLLTFSTIKSVLHFVIRLDAFLRFYAVLTKGTTVADFLFAFLRINSSEKWSPLKGKN